jgi:type IV pilus assembly protein PilA
MRKVKDLKGFTLIEILIVIGLIAVLAAVTIIALNPTASFERQRNSERQTEMAQIHTGYNRWVAEGNSATLTSGGNPLPTCAGTILTSHGVAFTSINIFPTLTAGGYVPAGITDPETGDYRVCAATNAQLTLFAPQTDGTIVTMTR